MSPRADRPSVTKTPYFRTYSRRALLELPQTLHGDRGRRDHPKRCQSFLDPTHSFFRYTVIWATNQLGDSHLGDKFWTTGRHELGHLDSGRQDINFLNATFAESNAVNVRQTTAADTANRSSFTFCGTNYAENKHCAISPSLCRHCQSKVKHSRI